MKISKIEYMKIFDYILENYNNLVDNKNISNNFLIQIRNYVKNKRLDDNFMEDIHKNLIINHFLKYGKTFNQDTPNIILNNEQCIAKSIKNNVNSINYITNKKYFDKCINIALTSNYILSNNSPSYLKSNKKIIIHSLNIDINTYQYSLIYFYNDYDIFKLLLDSNYNFSENDLNMLKKIPITYLKTENILNKVLELLDIYFFDNNNYKELYSKLYMNVLNEYPNIKSFDGIIDYLSECSWKEYQVENNEKLVNIFRKIISFIKYSKDYQEFNNKFKSLGKNMEYILKEKYLLLKKSIEEYYTLYHSDTKDRKKLELSSFIISKLSSLYVSKSKELHKQQIKLEFNKKIKDYFIPKLDNRIINKRILQYIKQDIFRKKYTKDDDDVLKFITDLKDKYIKLYGNWLCIPINKFFEKNITKLHLTIEKPNNYINYIKYFECQKLVNRLNNGYIQYNSPELTNYKEIIIKKNNIYINTIDINEFNIESCNNYYNKEIIFNKFIKEIMRYINNIEVNNKIFNKYLEDIELNKLLFDLPFNDNFFEFDKEIFNNYSLEYFINHCINTSIPINNNSLINKDNYQAIYNLLVNYSLIWIWMFNVIPDFAYINEIKNCKKNNVITIYNNIEKINNLSKYLNIDTFNFSNVILLNNICECSDNRSINLLESNTIKILCTNVNYTLGYDKKEIIDKASDLICQMVKRDKSTVPYINGYINGYHYSMYDSQDEDILLTGPYVDSCLKVLGNDNDFLQYIALDKNGFIIKIANENGSFIGRAAGFRNGNIIYINQLRTIYDKGGTGYCSNFDTESYEIVEVFKKACEDIINISQNNIDEKDKIDYIFVTQSYLLEKYETDENVSSIVRNLIGESPVDLSTQDWKEFVNNTKNLMKTNQEKCFTTDYDEYNLICLASSKKILKYEDYEDIKIGDVNALYNRPRNRIIVTSDINKNILRKINKIRTIYNYYHKEKKYYDNDITNNSIIILGDNWYTIYNNKQIVDYCVQEFDNNALKEFELVKKILSESNEKETIDKIKKLI